MAEVLVYEIHVDNGSTHTYLGASEKRITLPFMALPSADEAERIYRETNAEAEQLRASGSERMQYIADIEMAWVKRLVEAARTQAPHPRISGVVQAIRCDDVAILTAPAETFAKIGLEAKARSPLKHTLFVAYANGSLGYVRTPDAYPKPGQRGVTPDAIAHKWSFTTPFAPECGALIVDSGLELLEGLA